jgi:hypothetical protein
MQATFMELPSFERNRKHYLDDDGFREMQDAMMMDPVAGDVIKGAGGLRKLRWLDKRRSKGKRGGLRVIYYYWLGGHEFWLFTIFDKDEMTDLSPQERKALEALLRNELKERAS